MLSLNDEHSLAVSMTRDQSNTLGIASQCRQPDPLECHERQASCEQSEAESCLRCPVASWMTAIVFKWTNEGIGPEEVEPDALEPIVKTIASIQEARLGTKAA
jgi:hypothetical protein